MKSQSLFIYILPALLFISLSGCVIDLDDDDFDNCTRGRGSRINETLYVPYFEGIELQIPADVYIRQGDRLDVRVDGYANLIDELETDVRNGIWEIEFDRCVNNIDDFDIYITMPEINYLGILSSGRIYGDNVFIVGDIDLEILGSGDMDLALDADDIFSRISGSGDMLLEGVADEINHKVTGSGDMSAFGLEVRRADIEVTGSGDCSITALDFLRVRILGSGDVRFRGNPDLNIDVLGSGDVIDAN